MPFLKHPSCPLLDLRKISSPCLDGLYMYEDRDSGPDSDPDSEPAADRGRSYKLPIRILSSKPICRGRTHSHTHSHSRARSRISSPNTNFKLDSYLDFLSGHS